MKKTFLAFIKEIIPVIVGILIALFINNWNEERKEGKYITQILKSLELELDESKADIEKTIPKQKILIDSLKHYLSDKNISLLEVTLKTNGLNLPTIRTNSWIALSSTKIELIEYEKLSCLNNIEEGKKLLEKKSDYLLNFMMSNLDKKSKKIKKQAVILLTDVISTEIEIKKDIEIFETQK